MNIGKMMQQAKKMQEDMQKMQAEMAEMEVIGESGGGMVKVTMTGAHQVRRVEIDQSLWDEQDKDLIEDLIAAAVNSAAQVVEAKVKEQQQGMMAGMPLPPGFSL
ncbi:YbaB/EbfC family nucleoid-associated protein [Pseudomonadota bacterium]